MAAKAAGDAEDYAMDAGNEGEAPARDPASLERVELVHMTSGEIERMTPQLVTAAQVSDKKFRCKNTLIALYLALRETSSAGRNIGQ